jgi:uncharacterized protein YaaW (UPF0174 family)
MHVLIYPRGKDGKKLRLSKNDLRKIHNEWDNFLKQEGYLIRKTNKGTKPYWKYMREKTEEMGYIPLPDFIIDEEMMNKGKERFLKEMKRRNIEIKETEIYIFEDIIEKKALEIAENQMIRKMIKTKEYLKVNKEVNKVNNNNNNNNSNNWNNNSSNNSISRNPFSRNP